MYIVQKRGYIVQRGGYIVPAIYAQVMGDIMPPSQQRETTGHTPQGTVVSRFCAVISLLTYTDERAYAVDKRVMCAM